MVFTDHGLRAFVGAWHDLVKGVRFVVGGGTYGHIFPVDVGYPKFGDTDEANDGRGTNVYTWRITVKPGESWGHTPSEAVELVDSTGAVLLKRTLPEAFRAAPSFASSFYYNVMLRRL